MVTGKELVAWAGANGAAVNAIRHGSLKIKRKGRSAAKPQPKTLPLLHRMEERAGERRRAWLDCWESPLSSVLSRRLRRGERKKILAARDDSDEQQCRGFRKGKRFSAHLCEILCDLCVEKKPPQNSDCIVCPC